jgi:hypothetical protein
MRRRVFMLSSADYEIIEAEDGEAALAAAAAQRAA